MNGARRTVLCGLLLTVAASASEADEPDWQILKPSNTGIPGDYIQTTFVEGNDRPYITTYVPIWKKGSIVH